MGKGNRLRTERRLTAQATAEEEALVRRTRKEALDQGAAEGKQRGCLFCRRNDRSFTSEEHIFPEGLGNTEHILPVGVVCDACNNGALSQVDEALQGFLPIELLRTWHGVPSKSGSLPSFKFNNGVLRCLSPGELDLSLDSAKGQPATQHLDGGRVKTGFTAARNDGSPRRLRNVHRALLKMVVEYAWVDLGEAGALDAKFDHIRDRVLNGGYAGYLAFPERSNPSETIQFQYARRTRTSDGHPLVGLLASFWGFPIFTDSLFPEPPKGVPPGWSMHHFASV